MNWGTFRQKKTTGLTIAALIVSTFAYSQRSILNLQEVREPLQIVSECAAHEIPKPYGMIIVDGGRTVSEQKINVANGKSWTMRSRHLEGAAIDFAATIDGKVTYDPAPYYTIAEAFNKCSLKHDIPIVWGGIWKVKDLMHIELDRKRYP